MKKTELRMKLVQYYSLKLVFFLKYIITPFIFTILLLYLFLFNYISPGYNELKNVTIDITSWNSDDDIFSIETYFIELKKHKTRKKIFKDKNGIIYRKPYSDTRKYLMKPGTDSIYIAADMSRELIRNFTKFKKTHDSTYFNKIILYGNWLKDNAVVENDFAMWPYPFIFTKYNLDYDWCGSWALGNILSAISRHIELTNDSRFIKLADQIVNSFDTQIEENGILFIDDENNYWYEEYPTIPPNHVLNGHINGIFGLYDYWRITKNKKAKELFDKGVKTVANNIDKFDSGYWSYYDDKYPYLVDYFYHKATHIPQLKILYQITGEEIFLNYATKWEKYFGEPYYTIFKLKMIYDGLHRRFTYKSFFTFGR